MGRMRTAEHRLPRAMTLVELLLVLALLVIASSLTVPAIFDSFSSTRLRRAGDQVLSRWAEARAAAIESGTVQQFRFGVDTGAYRVESWSPLPADGTGVDATSQNDSARSDSASPSQGVALASEDAELAGSGVIAGRLQNNIVFKQGESVEEDPLSGQVQATALAAGEGDWSTPIFFFPDGTSSQATVVLANDKEHYLRLTLRALTGVGRSSDVLTRNELQLGAATR